FELRMAREDVRGDVIELPALQPPDQDEETNVGDADPLAAGEGADDLLLHEACPGLERPLDELRPFLLELFGVLDPKRPADGIPDVLDGRQQRLQPQRLPFVLRQEAVEANESSEDGDRL